MSDKESFVRWQNVAITQLGYALNLILALAVASLGFAFARLLDGKLCLTTIFRFSLLLLAISILSGLACTIVRLIDFRKTKTVASDRENLFDAGKTKPDVDSQLHAQREQINFLDKVVWWLFWLQLSSFISGDGLLGLAFLRSL